VDAKILTAFLQHKSEKWRGDVGSGRVVRVTVRNIGIGRDANVMMWIKREARNEVTSASEVPRQDKDETYLHRAGIDIWRCTGSDGEDYSMTAKVYYQE
jgi:hypothetical protein